MVWAARYEAFGKATITTPQATADKPTITSNLRLPGQYEDAETGLHYNYRRYYDPEIGRYISQDPIGLEGGVNLFSYVGGNPLSFIDPTGLIKHTTGLTKQCGNCTIRIDSVLDEKTGIVTRHLYWKCKGSSGVGGEFGGYSHGSTCSNAPKNVRACAATLGFQCDSPAPPEPDSSTSFACEDKCKRVLKSVRDAVTGALILVFVLVCATS